MISSLAFIALIDLQGGNEVKKKNQSSKGEIVKNTIDSIVLLVP